MHRYSLGGSFRTSLENVMQKRKSPAPRIKSYREFWPFYVSQHMNRVNRWLHFVGTTCVLLCLAFGLFSSWLFFFAMPLAGYGFAWIGHFFFEKNSPATFSYPFWSVVADFQMCQFMWRGRMNHEVEKVKRSRG